MPSTLSGPPTRERWSCTIILAPCNNDIDSVDLMIGMYAEQPPKGFGFSDTAFRVFILMASRRLNSDRFFTTDYNPKVYSQVGFDLVLKDDTTTVLLRHFPALAASLRD